MSGASTSPAPLSLSVVVATRERGDACQRLVDAVVEQFSREPGVVGEVVLVFDGCASYDWYRPSEEIRSVELAERAGIAGARNAGIAAAKGDVIAFLDDDCVPGPRWLSSLIRGLAQYPGCWAFGGRVIGTTRANVFAVLRDEVYYRETFGPWYMDRSDESDRLSAPYVNGGNSAYRREALDSSGGFDVTLPAYSDVDHGRRAAVRDRGVLLAGMAIHHDHPSTFCEYMKRCYRSGVARAMLWSRHRYEDDAPSRVTRTIVSNVLWRNCARRCWRVPGHRVQAAVVLSCQEVMHGWGYCLGSLKTR